MLIVSINLSHQKKTKKTVDTILIIFDDDQRNENRRNSPREIPTEDGRNPFELRELQLLSIFSSRLRRAKLRNEGEEVRKEA